MKSNQVSIKAVALLSLAVTIVWSVLDMRGYLSLAIGFSPRVPLNLVWGIDTFVWTLCFYLFGKQSELRLWNSVTIGAVIIFVPSIIASFFDPGAQMKLRAYDEKVTQATIIVGVIVSLLALAFDEMIRLEERYRAKQAAEPQPENG